MPSAPKRRDFISAVGRVRTPSDERCQETRRIQDRPIRNPKIRQVSQLSSRPSQPGDDSTVACAGRRSCARTSGSGSTLFGRPFRPPTRALSALSADHADSPLDQPTGYLDSLACVSFRKWRRVVLGGCLETEQLRELANREPAILASSSEEAQRLCVLSCGVLADKSACDGIARAYPGRHGAAGGNVPTLGSEAFGCGFQPCARFGQVSASVGRGDRVAAARTRAHRGPLTTSSSFDPARTTESRRTASQKARPTLALGRLSGADRRGRTRVPGPGCRSGTEPALRRPTELRTTCQDPALGDLTASTSRSLSASASPRGKDP